jgi:hypothetical protein
MSSLQAADVGLVGFPQPLYRNHGWCSRRQSPPAACVSFCGTVGSNCVAFHVLVPPLQLVLLQPDVAQLSFQMAGRSCRCCTIAGPVSGGNLRCRPFPQEKNYFVFDSTTRKRRPACMPLPILCSPAPCASKVPHLRAARCSMAGLAGWLAGWLGTEAQSSISSVST